MVEQYDYYFLCSCFLTSAFVVVFRHTTNEAWYSGHRFSGAVSEADGSKIQDVRISKYGFLILLNATPWTPLLDKALETLYPVLTSKQQQELDVFSAAPEGVTVEEIRLANALANAANGVAPRTPGLLARRALGT
jgi:hypothetical protein